METPMSIVHDVSMRWPRNSPMFGVSHRHTARPPDLAFWWDPQVTMLVSMRIWYYKSGVQTMTWMVWNTWLLEDPVKFHRLSKANLKLGTCWSSYSTPSGPSRRCRYPFIAGEFLMENPHRKWMITSGIPLWLRKALCVPGDTMWQARYTRGSNGFKYLNRRQHQPLDMVCMRVS